MRAVQGVIREAEQDENKRTRVLKATTTLIEDVGMAVMAAVMLARVQM